MNETVSDSLEMMPFRCHKQRLDMTKTELQVALAAATETNKRIAGVFLDTLGKLAYKEIKKDGEFVVPGFGKLLKQEKEGSHRLQSQDAAKDQNSSQDRRSNSESLRRQRTQFWG